uniref:Uncharacterized protein n=1 Tax=Arundo donax TaxID=35708 RepID=A0A0A9C0D9_ARUDO
MMLSIIILGLAPPKFPVKLHH